MDNENRVAAIFDLFEDTCKKNLLKEAISFKNKDAYIWLTYQDLYAQSVSFADFLKKNKLLKGDKIAIILENNPYWPVAFFGAMCLGVVTVPLCAQFEIAELAYLIKHSESKIVITSKNSLEKIKETIKDSRIPIFDISQIDISKEKGKNFPENTFKELLPPEHIASIVYTSGTTAQPKGVILTHGNLLANFKALSPLNLILPSDNVLSLLPLHHTYPFMVNLLLPLLTGARISFPHGLNFEEILLCIKKTQVTILVAVPRIYALFCEKISANINALPAAKRCLLNLLLNLSLPMRKYLRVNLSKLAARALHEKIGKDLRFMVSGGAKLKTEVAENLYKLGFTILEGYGLTETSPVISFNLPSDFKIGSVGKPIPGVEVQINEPDQSGVGEIIVKGKSVTQGYYKDPEFSAQAIKNGWLYTRDLGCFDKDGFLFISGRKNETLVLTSGEKIDPEELETYYSKSQFIKEICVFLLASDADKDLLMAVIFPDLDYFRAQNVAQIKDKIRFEIENLSARLPVYKRIRKYMIINEKLPRTLLGKLKRFEIEKHYSQDFQNILEEKAAVKEILPEDKEMFSSRICQDILRFLSEKLKRPVNLDDHLELDLGLDSLERISLFFELQKRVGEDLDEKLFFSVATVRDVLSALQSISGMQANNEQAPDWKEILVLNAEKNARENIQIEYNLLEKAANLILISLLRGIGRVFFMLSAKGRENIPKTGAFIFCPNHSSYLDPPFFAAALEMPVLLKTYILGFSAYINHPLLSWAKKLCRLIPLDTAAKLTDTLSACSYVLNNSKALCIFPEGGRSIDGDIKAFKRGVGIFIKELNVPVIPVYIRGAYKAWPPGRAFPVPSKIEVIFGKKITIEELTANLKEGVDIYQNIADNLRRELIKLQQAAA